MCGRHPLRSDSRYRKAPSNFGVLSFFSPNVSIGNQTAFCPISGSDSLASREHSRRTIAEAAVVATVNRGEHMDTRFCLQTRARVRPLAVSLALAFAGAIASPYSDAL